MAPTEPLNAGNVASRTGEQRHDLATSVAVLTGQPGPSDGLMR